jgi:hypothetical protein
MKLKMEIASKTDAAEIVAFGNYYRGEERTPEQWLWEFRGMNGDSSVFGLLKEDGKIVGTCGMIPIYLWAGDRRVLSAKMESGLIDPRYRGTTTFQNLVKFTESDGLRKGVCVMWGFTHKDRANQRWGFRAYPHIMYTILGVLNLRSAFTEQLVNEKHGLWSKLRRLGAYILLWAYGSILRIKISGEPAGFSITDRLLQPSDITKLYERLRKKYPEMVHIDLNETYLRWRVYDHPFLKYDPYFLYEGQTLRAYAFVNRHETGRAYISDLTFDSAAVGKILLRKILRDMKEKGVGVVAFHGNEVNPVGRQIFRLLRLHGFLRFAWIHMVVRNLSFHREDLIFSEKNWYMNGLSTEGYEI